MDKNSDSTFAVAQGYTECTFPLQMRRILEFGYPKASNLPKRFKILIFITQLGASHHAVLRYS